MTVRDIAKEAGVSIATVSRILNNDYSSVSTATKERVQKVIADSGYVLKERKGRTHFKRFALVVPNASQMFFAAVVKAANRYALAHNMEMVLFSLDEDPEIMNIVINRIKGSDIPWVLYMGIGAKDNQSVAPLLDSGKKVVYLDNIFYRSGISAAVIANGEAAMFDITRLLISKGHRDIAYITGTNSARFNNDRHVGYVMAMFDKNITVNPVLTRFGNFTFESGYGCTNDLFDLKVPFTAIICENDLIAYGAVTAIREHGLRVPEDISVTGFDDMELSEKHTPPLTTVRQPLDDIIAKAFELLKRMNDGEMMSNYMVKLPCTIIERESVSDINEE